MGKDLKNKRKLNEDEVEVQSKKKKININNESKNENKPTPKAQNKLTPQKNKNENNKPIEAAKKDTKPKENKKDNNKTDNKANNKTDKKPQDTKPKETPKNNKKDNKDKKPNTKPNNKENKNEKKTNDIIVPLDAPLFPSGAPSLVTRPADTQQDNNVDEKLKSSQFRYLNEQLYTMTGNEAEEYFKKNPELPEVYHMGYRRQVLQWPLNPLTKIIERIKEMKAGQVIADFGCGDAQLALEVGSSHTVHSFDLFKANDRVTKCEMSNVPLKKESVDVAVFSLSLMGSNLKDYITEANRVLKTGGILLIAEVRSRFENFHDFIEFLIEAGFVYDKSNSRDKMFVWFEFHKSNRGFYSSKERAVAILKPCKYKKR